MKTSFHIKPETEPIHRILKTAKDLDPLIEKVGDARFVLLGEATHGTHEFYKWRTEISKRLIEEKGFSFIAVEGDWPDCYKINRFIKGYKNAGTKITEVLHEFNRWPSWMWANWEVAALSEWLLTYNKKVGHDKKVGFYGLDVYSLWDSMKELIRFLDKKDPDSAAKVREAIHCFEPYHDRGYNYAKAVATFEISCKEEVTQMLAQLRSQKEHYEGDHETAFNAEQNAFVAVNAEEYYRSMLGFGPDSWNIRDKHMADTLDRLMELHGPNAKAIIWEHNTHIGDARATDMKDNGLWNVGQLVRQEHDDEGVMLIGFGTYQGTVIAGTEWDAPMEIMHVPPARPGSLEYFLHEESDDDRIILLNNTKDKLFQKAIPHRAIGVVYDPSRERWGNYVPTVLSERYNAFVYIDTTMALHPMHIHPEGHKIPETYPFGV